MCRNPMRGVGLNPGDVLERAGVRYLVVLVGLAHVEVVPLDANDKVCRDRIDPQVVFLHEIYGLYVPIGFYDFRDGSVILNGSVIEERC